MRAIAAFGATLGVGAVVGRLTPAGAPLRRAAARHARAALRIAGLRPRVTGLARIPEGAAILIANHASYLDPIVCQATLPVDTRFAVKGELRDNPVLGPLVPKAGHVLIDRHAALRSLADLEELSRLLADGARVLLFPEGTFTPEVGMRPFKLGAFRLACETGVPVVPIALRGTRSAWRDGTRLPRRARIEVEVLEPITPIGRDLADIVDLRDRVAAVIAAHLDEPRLYAADITVPGGRSRDAG
ncbi:MAG: 1-acyl-sn-glycerol-3-phosphate acyltransferase [Myxococcales bacterium]|nr:1-acyl-sn-glycerol-3-phosphate acyltransferase [Myxococcales bacterium]